VDSATRSPEGEQMFRKLEELSDRMLSKFVPATSAAASCPCGAYPYTGPCYYILPCSGGQHKQCYCADSGRIVSCGACHID
jgi:hypothetical protein